MTASLNTLSDDEITAGVNSGDRLFSGANLPARQGTLSVHDFDQNWIGICIEELDDVSMCSGCSDQFKS